MKGTEIVAVPVLESSVVVELDLAVEVKIVVLGIVEVT